MAWLELHQTLPTNKKTLRLKKLLKIKTPQAVGHLCMLWLWALDNAPDGNLSAFEADEIAEVAEWTGKDPECFVEALIKSGFVDSDKCLHDWSDYAGRLIDQRAVQREQSRIRKQRQRDKDKEKVSGHDSVTRDERDKKTDVTPLPYPTVPNSTLPYPTEDLYGDGDDARRGARENGSGFEGEGPSEVTPDMLFKKYFGKIPTDAERGVCQIFLDKFDNDVLEAAFFRACELNNKNFGYVKGIMENYQKRGVKDMGDVADDDMRHAEAKGRLSHA